jgi:cell division septation protein DedD
VERPAGTAASVTLPANYQPPRIPRGAVLLQVAALTSESDALAMASALHQKQFPAFVVPPSGADKYYRVQVGPYSDAHAAKAVRGMLDQAGFRSIIKH